MKGYKAFIPKLPFTPCHFELSSSKLCSALWHLKFCLLILRASADFRTWHHNTDEKSGSTPVKSIILPAVIERWWGKSPRSQQGRNDRLQKAEFWTDALLITQPPWAVGCQVHPPLSTICSTTRCMSYPASLSRLDNLPVPT